MKKEKILIGVLMLHILGLCLAMYIVYDFYNDYKCSTMSIKEFVKNDKCKEYLKIKTIKGK